MKWLHMFHLCNSDVIWIVVRWLVFRNSKLLVIIDHWLVHQKFLRYCRTYVFRNVYRQVLESIDSRSEVADLKGAMNKLFGQWHRVTIPREYLSCWWSVLIVYNITPYTYTNFSISKLSALSTMFLPIVALYTVSSLLFRRTYFSAFSVKLLEGVRVRAPLFKKTLALFGFLFHWPDQRRRPYAFITRQNRTIAVSCGHFSMIAHRCRHEWLRITKRLRRFHLTLTYIIFDQVFQE